MKQPKVTLQSWTPRCPSKDIPIRLIRALRGVDSASMHSSPRLSLTKIRALTGVSMQAIKSALGNFRGMYRIKCTCRFCPEKELTQEEVDYLCEEHTLTLWRTLSLVQRTRIFSIRFPGRQISVDKLRRVYRLNGIKMRALKFKKSLIWDILWNYICQFGATSIPRPPGAGPAGASP